MVYYYINTHTIYRHCCYHNGDVYVYDSPTYFNFKDNFKKCILFSSSHLSVYTCKSDFIINWVFTVRSAYFETFSFQYVNLFIKLCYYSRYVYVYPQPWLLHTNVRADMHYVLTVWQVSIWKYKNHMCLCVCAYSKYQMQYIA